MPDPGWTPNFSLPLGQNGHIRTSDPIGATMTSTHVGLTPGATIGWIGTGIMGAPMAGHAVKAGFAVRAWARRPEAAEVLTKYGVDVVDEASAVAEGADAIVTIVSMPSDVRNVVLGEGGLLDSAKSGSVLVDMTTSEPSLAIEIAKRAAERGVGSVDAPVSGGQAGAENGKLSVMVGGSDDDVAVVMPLLESFAAKIIHQGAPGAGQHTKMANQISVAGSMIGLCESLMYAAGAGLDLEKVVQTVSAGAGGSAAYTAMGPKVVAGDMSPGFRVEHFLKDLGIVLAESKAMKIALPGTAVAEQLYRATMALGHDRDGTQALIQALAHLNNRDWPSA